MVNIVVFVILLTSVTLAIEAIIITVILNLLNNANQISTEYRAAYLIAVLGLIFIMVITIIKYFQIAMPYLKLLDK